MEKKALQYSTIDEYIALQPVERQDSLREIRETIKKAAPDAEEVISYQMPAFKYHGMLAFFAAYKNHYGLYIPGSLKPFTEKLAEYEISKATIRLPVDKPIPKKLIAEIIKSGLKENLAKAKLKEMKKPGTRQPK